MNGLSSIASYTGTTRSINEHTTRNAIILQNQYQQVGTLPVIGLSPKAMKEIIQVGGSPVQTVLQLLNHYTHFSSIEPTSKLEELDLYFFLTTDKPLKKAKKFVMTTLLQIWVKLDNNFLD
jgi:hypothetical protein